MRICTVAMYHQRDDFVQICILEKALIRVNQESSKSCHVFRVQPNYWVCQDRVRLKPFCLAHCSPILLKCLKQKGKQTYWKILCWCHWWHGSSSFSVLVWIAGAHQEAPRICHGTRQNHSDTSGSALCQRQTQNGISESGSTTPFLEHLTLLVDAAEEHIGNQKQVPASKAHWHFGTHVCQQDVYPQIQPTEHFCDACARVKQTVANCFPARVLYRKRQHLPPWLLVQPAPKPFRVITRPRPTDIDKLTKISPKKACRPRKTWQPLAQQAQRANTVF